MQDYLAKLGKGGGKIYMKWVLGIIAFGGILLIAQRIYWNSQSLEYQVAVAKHMEFCGESYPPDGGSHVFYFRLPHKQPMALLVLHRQAVLGGNPNFQEIRIDRHGGFASYVDVKEGSKLEKKLLDLLQTATVNTNRADNCLRPPQSENLKWIVQRIQDRRSKW